MEEKEENLNFETAMKQLEEIANQLAEKKIEIINARFLKPLDEETILKKV